MNLKLISASTMVRLFLFILLFSPAFVQAQDMPIGQEQDFEKAIAQANIKATRGELILATLLTGPLGGHRILLKSKPRVMIFYALTLGGGFGLLPLIDLGHILFTKDLRSLENRGLFIFNKEKAEDQIILP